MARTDSLSERQLQVLCLIARGASVSEAAFELGRSLKSVDSHIHRIKRVLGLSDRMDLARVAIQDGLVEVDSVDVSTTEPSVLTERQREVLTLIAKGERVRQVAEILGISERAADSHKTRGMHQLGIHDRIEVLYYALQQGLIDINDEPASSEDKASPQE